jgi:putative oxidoreductase
MPSRTGGAIVSARDATRAERRPTVAKKEDAMNAALLVLRLVPGLLFVGHGLMKLVPPELSPRLLSANGPKQTAAAFSQMGLEPAVLLTLLTAAGEVGGGFLIASGLVTPLGTAVLAAVMTVAIVVVHLPHGIWNSAGGFEFPLLMLTTAYVVSALGPGTLSLDHAFGISNWLGIHWAVDDTARAGAAVGVGAAAGLLTLAAARARKAVHRQRQLASAGH